MPLVRTEENYENLKEKIDIAKAMREHEHTYKDIATELCVSIPMAWEYVNYGDEMINKYRPSEDEEVKWNEIYLKIKRVAEKVPDFDIAKLRDMWSREVAQPKKFKLYINSRLEEDFH